MQRLSAIGTKLRVFQPLYHAAKVELYEASSSSRVTVTEAPGTFICILEFLRDLPHHKNMPNEESNLIVACKVGTRKVGIIVGVDDPHVATCAGLTGYQRCVRTLKHHTLPSSQSARRSSP